MYLDEDKKRPVKVTVLEIKIHPSGMNCRVRRLQVFSPKNGEASLYPVAHV